MQPNTSAPNQEEVRHQLDRMLGSELFRAAGRSSQVLRFVVEHALSDSRERLKEYTIGAEALGRGDSFDPRIDSVARVEASRLRGKLEQYFAGEGNSDPVVIQLPKGGYVPIFERRAVIASGVSPDGGQARRMLYWGLISAVLLVAGALWRPWGKPAAVPRPMVKFEAELWSGGEIGSVVGTNLVLSPEGSRMVFVAFNANGIAQLHTRRLDDLEISLLPGTEGARNPFFSPDGQWIAFWADHKLKKAPVTGTSGNRGAPMILCDALGMAGGSWGDDGNLVVSLAAGPKLAVVPASGGNPRTTVEMPRGVNPPRWLQVLPGSQAVLYTNLGSSGADVANLEVISVADGRRKVLVRGGTFGRYMPSGHLAYINQGTLYVIAFDLTRLEVQGSPVPFVNNVAYSQVFGFAQFDFSQSGILAYRRSAERGDAMPTWLDANERTTPILAQPGPYQFPRLSPDGKVVALSRFDSDGSHLWLATTKEGKLSELPSSAKTQMAPLWTRDGRFLIFSAGNSIEWMAVDGVGKKGTLLRGSTVQIPWSFNADGNLMAYHKLDAVTHFDLWTVPLHEQNGELVAGEPREILKTPAVETYPAFSPDGRWLAYTSNRSGAYEVYVRPFPQAGPDRQISQGGGRCPRWHAGGKEIFYSAIDRQTMSVPYRIQGGVFEVDAPKRWSKTPLADTNVLPAFDLAPDGRVLALLPTDSSQRPVKNHVTFVVNFFDEVRRRMSTGVR